MNRTALMFFVCGVLLLALTGCLEETTVELPQPRELTRDAVGHYCGMIVEDHPGPKAQVFVAGRDTPIWFSSVRDAFAFTKLPGEVKNIRAIYVNDMGKATNWNAPETGTWIDARKAHFVLNSDRRGGMGAKETVPFSNSEAAAGFIAKHGGNTVDFSEVPADYVLGDDNPQSGADAHEGHHGLKKRDGES